MNSGLSGHFREGEAPVKYRFPLCGSLETRPDIRPECVENNLQTDTKSGLGTDIAFSSVTFAAELY